MTVQYNPYSEAILEDPWPVYRALRDEQPAYYIEDLDAWALSRFDDVWKASMNRESLTASRGTSLDALVQRNMPSPHVFLFMDPPEHRQHRDLIAPIYQRDSIAGLESKVRTTVRELLRKELAHGEMDVYSVAGQVALRVMGDIIGLQLEEIQYIRSCIDRFYLREPGHRGTTPSGQQAFLEAREFILDLIKGFRSRPAPEGSHIHTWMNAEVNGTRMSDEEVFFSTFALSITGSDTMPLNTAGTVYQLARHPEQMQAVRADRSLVPYAFAETARYDQPTNILGRFVTRDFELHDKTLREGQVVLFLFASANRDEREFENPDTYSIHRRPRRVLSFGAGVHSCLGQHLARFEGRIILEELFDLIPAFEVLEDDCRRIRGEFLQGYCSVPIRF